MARPQPDPSRWPASPPLPPRCFGRRTAAAPEVRCGPLRSCEGGGGQTHLRKVTKWGEAGGQGRGAPRALGVGYRKSSASLSRTVRNAPRPPITRGRRVHCHWPDVRGAGPVCPQQFRISPRRARACEDADIFRKSCENLLLTSSTGSQSEHL